MTVTYPYSLAFLADRLKIDSVIFDIQRNDEVSGSGDGRYWQAELAPPLWVATVTLATMLTSEAKQIAAKLRKLHGAQEAMFLYDPTSKYPANDPEGSVLDASVVRIAAVGGDFNSLSFSGAPAGYKLTTGDKMQISYGSNPTRYAFLEVSEDAIADGTGLIPTFGVFPTVPTGVVANLQVILAKPALKCAVMPGTHNPGTANKDGTTTGATFKVIQKK